MAKGISLLSSKCMTAGGKNLGVTWSQGEDTPGSTNVGEGEYIDDRDGAYTQTDSTVYLPSM